MSSASTEAVKMFLRDLQSTSNWKLWCVLLYATQIGVRMEDDCYQDIVLKESFSESRQELSFEILIRLSEIWAGNIMHLQETWPTHFIGPKQPLHIDLPRFLLVKFTGKIVARVLSSLKSRPRIHLTRLSWNNHIKKMRDLNTSSFLLVTKPALLGDCCAVQYSGKRYDLLSSWVYYHKLLRMYKIRQSKRQLLKMSTRGLPCQSGCLPCSCELLPPASNKSEILIAS